MRLGAMADAYKHQLSDPEMGNLSFEERIALLVDIEWTNRKNNRLKRLIANATFDQPRPTSGISISQDGNLTVSNWLCWEVAVT